MKHLLSADDLTKEDVQSIFEKAKWFESNQEHSKVLQGKILGSMFFEPSTRTRWSTEAAMTRLGGEVLSFECAKESSSDRKGEPLRDTLKTVSQYVDILAIRHPVDKSIAEAAPYSDVPIINSGDGANEHPTQALLDLFTIKKHFGEQKGLSILFTGDLACSRTIHSLLKLLVPYEPDVMIGVEENTICDNPCGSTKYYYREDIYTQLPKIDILYMTRHQTERNVERKKSSFILSNSLAQTMKNTAIIMHPLPRTEELLPDVDENHRAVYFEQVKNGLWIRMGLLVYMLSNCSISAAHGACWGSEKCIG